MREATGLYGLPRTKPYAVSLLTAVAASKGRPRQLLRGLQKLNQEESHITSSFQCFEGNKS